jgi:hypothetical protein
MKTVERIVNIKNFFLRKIIMGPILLVIILVSGAATGYDNHLFDNWVAHTDSVSITNTSKIEANTKAIEKLQADVVAKPPVIIVQKVIVPAKPIKTAKPIPSKPHGILTKLKNFFY